MYTKKSNNGHNYAATYVRLYDNNTVELVSYATTVIIITSDGWMTITGLYSRTTIKHISWFMRERGMTYQLAKSLYKDGMKMNIYTGEIKAV